MLVIAHAHIIFNYAVYNVPPSVSGHSRLVVVDVTTERSRRHVHITVLVSVGEPCTYRSYSAVLT